MVDNVPDALHVLILVIEPGLQNSMLTVVVTDPQDNVINEQKHTPNFLIKFNATIPG